MCKVMNIDRNDLCNLLDISLSYVIDEKDQIRLVIERKYARAILDEKGQRRAVNALARMGFRYADIKSVLREYTEIEDNYE